MVARVGVEIGGTFTDLVWQRADGGLVVHKVLSTPEAIHEAVLGGLDEAGVALAEVPRLAHGSTVATNALLTRRGARCGLITTEGFRDVIELGTHDRLGNVYQILYRKPRPPIARRHVREVPERLRADGSVRRPLDEAALAAAIDDLLADGIESFAVSFLHAYANPAHEEAALAVVRRRAPGAFVCASHRVAPEFREYPRTMTTAVNAFVGPVVARYVARLESGLVERGFAGALQVMQSSGGILPAAAAGERAVRVLLSGPAAGVRGALWFARRNGLADVVTLDMGGTSSDVCLAPGLAPQARPETLIDGLPIRAPALDIATVDAGGGSIAALDPGGFLAVGPESAGAEPGPACYGRGGVRATVTDAQVVAGLLRPERFFGGRLRLDVGAARAALAAVGLDTPPEETADAVLRVVNGNMAAALRLVSTERGIDPRDFTLVAYGGGGPLHAAMVAEEVGIERVLVPWAPGMVSAFGLLVADLAVDLVETRIHPVDDATFGGETLARLREAGLAAARAHGLDVERVALAYALDLRYPGQAYELTVPVVDPPATGERLRSAFAAAHRQRYGYAREGLAVEAVNYRVRVVEPVAETLALPGPARNGPPRLEAGAVRLAGAAAKARFVARETLPAGWRVEGPAVVEEATATTVVPAGWDLSVLETGDMLMERKRR